jgi:type I restriction enzyme S subunit
MVEWKSIGDLGHYFGGLTGKTKDDFVDGNAKFITYMNVFANPSLDISSTGVVRIKQGEKQNKIQKGDILFTGSSETPEEAGMSCVVTEDLNEDVYMNSFCFGIRIRNSKQYNLNYLKHILRSYNIRNEIAKSASGVTRFNISKARFGRIRIPIPSLSEQTRIVGILDTFTASIENLKEQIAQRRKQYEYYRDQLLDLEGKEGVEMRMCGDVCEVTDYVANGSFASLRENVSYKQEPDYAILVRTIDLSNNFDEDKIYIDERAYKFLSKSTLFGGEIIINNIGAGVGQTFRCPYLKERMSLGPNSILIRTSNNDFFYYWFNSVYGQNAIIKVVTPGAMPKFNKTGFKTIMVPVPSLSEQSRIVSILDTFEASIANLEAQLKEREKQYEYYRNKLLTFE